MCDVTRWHGGCKQVTYITIMDGFARQGDAKACRAVLRRMSAQGVEPDVVAYNILLRVSVFDSPPWQEVCSLHLWSQAQGSRAPGRQTQG